MDKITRDVPEYLEPEVVDYGKLEDLTEANGTGFIDTPLGTPTPGITTGSHP